MLRALFLASALFCAVAFAGKGFAASDENFAAMNFMDGKPRTAADFAGQTVAVVAFCRVWGGFPASVLESIRQLVDRRNKDHLPLVIIVTTSDGDIRRVESILTSTGVPDDPASGVIYAGTPLRGSAVYALGGILRPDGRAERGRAISGLLTASPSEFGSHRISKEGLSAEPVTAAWWYLTTGNWGAAAALARGARGPIKEEADILLGRVQDHLQKRFDALTLPIADIDAFDRASELAQNITESQIRALSGIERELTQALRVAAREPSLQDEIKARSAYFKLQEGASDRRTRERESANEAFAQLVEHLPDTKWGKRAAARLKVLAPK